LSAVALELLLKVVVGPPEEVLMRARLLAGSILAVATLAFTQVSSAAVHVRIAISPATIPQCGQGQMMFAVSNDGTSPILARLCWELARNDTTLVGPICGRLPLPAGGHLQHEFDFIVPPRMPLGDYALHVHATGSDGSSDDATATFTVVAGSPTACGFGGSGTPAADLVQNAMTSSGVTPDQVAPTSSSTWGQVKLIYR
jgi:hypothetical protein